MSSSPSAETEVRLRAILTAANQPAQGRLRPVSHGLWRWTVGDSDLVLKLFDGPNADERLRTEAALYRELALFDAPVPSFAAEVADARALARAWIPGRTLYQRLLATGPFGTSEAQAVRRAWHRLLQALARWNARIPDARRQDALNKRQAEIATVAQAVAGAFASIPADAIDVLGDTVVSDDLTLLPLDSSPSNIIIDGDRVAFIDLELIGLDFADWTYAKYVTAVDERGVLRSVVTAHRDDQALDRHHAAVALLSLAHAAGLWGEPRILPSTLATRLPGRSTAARRIRAGLRLELTVTSESG